MNTDIIKITDLKSQQDDINKAAQILISGGLVAIPTETVYGLAANALDINAVSNIFLVKGRPQDNPLIVHISDKKELYKLVLGINEIEEKLIDTFWPGPLTIIFKKSNIIPDVVTGGLDSVAIRLPENIVARSIISASGVPIAAPSANISGKPSPTKASHVYDDLDGKIPLIVDFGDCDIGLESTVVRVEGDKIRILRPGKVTQSMLKEATDFEVLLDKAVVSKLSDNEIVHSPGTKYKHYSPNAKVILIDSNFEEFKLFVEEKENENVFALCFNGEDKNLSVKALCYGNLDDEATQARELFSALRELDKLGAKTIYARCPNIKGEGLAVYNRLIRAAGFEVIKL